MSRINVPYTDGDGNTKTGWFDDDSAVGFREDTNWDGNNHVGVISGIPSNFGFACLYRTSGGRWVSRVDSTSYYGGPDAYEFLTDAEAREWMLRSGNLDDEIQEYFGKVEEESGPGRPKVGPPVSLAFPETMIVQVDARAAELKISRAELVRQYVAAGLAAPR